MRTLIRTAVALAFVAAVVAAIVVVDFPAVSEREVQRAVFTAIERESAESFLVTGSLEITATTLIEDTRVLLPSVVGLDLGTARARVRVPGRVSYGFSADALRPEMVGFTGEGVIELELPPLEIYSVEPDLTALEVETDRGWARLPGAQAEAERQAIAIIEGALRRQATVHLNSSYQPRINSARALQRLLSRALQGLGMADPVFRYHLGEGLTVEPSG